MATFIGTKKEFHDFIGPRLRNKIQTLTKPVKTTTNNICQHCGKTVSGLEAAHVHGRERKDIINGLLSHYSVDNGYKVDLQKFEEEFICEHLPIENNFLFLCKKCHRKYDQRFHEEEIKQVIQYKPPKSKATINNSALENIISSEVLPESDLFVACGIEKQSGESLQNHVKRVFAYLIEKECLSNREIESLKDKEYTNRIIGLNDAFLSEERWFDSYNNPRSWATPIHGYYLCSEWNKRRFHILEPNFRKWAANQIRSSQKNE